MTIENNASLTKIDTSNLSFNLSPRIKELMEADLNIDSGLMTMMFLPTEVQPDSVLSFVSVVQEQEYWQICLLEVFEVNADSTGVEELGCVEFNLPVNDDEGNDISDEERELVQKWQDYFIKQLDKHGGLLPNSNFTSEHLKLIRQANSLYAELVCEQLPELVESDLPTCDAV